MNLFFKKILSILLALSMMMSMVGTPALADALPVHTSETVEAATAETIVGFGAFDLSGNALSASAAHRPTEAELTARMPKTLPVILSNGRTEEAPVEWYCITQDYDKAEYYYYQFSPKWNPAAYVLDRGLDVITDAPYIGVSFYEDWQGGISTQSVCAAAYASYEQKTFTFLITELKLEPAQAIGIMANIYAESAFVPNNLQGDYEKKYKHNDASYTSAVDNGKYRYSTYKNAKDSFVHDSAGYGLCQWTYYTRKQGLYEYAKSKKTSISDFQMQLEYLKSELEKDYGSMMKTIRSYPNTAKGAYDTAALFCKKFEAPSNTAVRMKERGLLAQNSYWKEYEHFRIPADQLPNDNFLSSYVYTYDSTPKMPKVNMDTTGCDVIYRNNRNAGTAEVIVARYYVVGGEEEEPETPAETPDGEVSGDTEPKEEKPLETIEEIVATRNFIIKPRSITKAAAALSFTNAAYTGSAIKPTVTVKDKLSNKTVTLKNGTDYTVSYSANKAVGLATVTITGKGNYSGSVKKTFNILPKKTAVSSVSNKKSKKLTVKWKKNTTCGGYQVQVATDKDFTKNVKSKTVSKYKTTSTTLTGLKKKTVYYVRIRSFKKVSGKTYAAPWAVYGKTVKTK